MIGVGKFRLAPQQEAAYPWVKSLSLSSPPAEVVARVVTVLEEMGLEVVGSDVSAGLVEVAKVEPGHSP